MQRIFKLAISSHSSSVPYYSMNNNKSGEISRLLWCEAVRCERSDLLGVSEIDRNQTPLIKSVSGLSPGPRALSACLVREDSQNHISMLIPEQSVTQPYFTGL